MNAKKIEQEAKDKQDEEMILKLIQNDQDRQNIDETLQRNQEEKKENDQEILQ